MSSGMFVIQDDNLIEMVQEPYVLEDDLQRWLAKWPGLIPGDQIDSLNPRRFVLISREFGIAGSQDGGDRWFLDHLFLDQDAIPTLVEVKRASDSRVRREVVAQMLDYAANGVSYSSVDRIRELFSAKCKEDGVDPGDAVIDLIGATKDVEEYWETVKNNLDAGIIRMVFVSDEIPAELLRIVEFLNTQMSPAQVMAVEIRQFVGQNLKTLVPRLLGFTEEAKTKKSSARRGFFQWDETSFFARLRDNGGPGIEEAARELLSWAGSQQLNIAWGSGESNGSLMLKLYGRQICSLDISGRLWITVGYIGKLPPFDTDELREDLLSRLRSVANLTPNAKSQPTVEPRVFADQGKRRALLDVLAGVVSAIRDASDVL